MKGKLSPQKATTTKQLCSLRRDNYSTPRNWILVEEKKVCIHTQKAGNPSTGNVTISKKDFDRLIKFYLTKQQTINRK